MTMRPLALWKKLVRTHLPETEKVQSSPERAPQQVIDLMRGKLAGQIQKVRSGMNITYGVLNGERSG